MRFHSFVVALLLACAPSVLNAQGTSRRCEDYKTQVRANECTGLAMDRADSAMDGVYRQIVAELDPALVPLFEKVQRAWEAMREAECLLHAEPMRDGSIYPAEYGACVAEQTRRRTRDLRQRLTPPAGKFPERFAVEEATRLLFRAMAAKDTAGLRRLIDPRALIVSVPEQGPAQVRTVDEWIPSVARNPEMLRERMWDAEVEVEGNLATLWAPYEFHLGERFSHCGSDAFQFVREGSAWKLIAITFTRRTTGCEHAP